MNEDYNSRQRKIYNDYKGHSSDNLLEIVKNGDKYLPEVIEVIYDILIERDVVFPRIEMEEPEETVFIGKEKVDADSENSFKETIAAGRGEYEIRSAEIDLFLSDKNSPVETLSDEDLETEREKFWKCPKCGELVEMEFAVCWKCQGEVPESIEHPDKEEIIKQLTDERSFNPLKIGYTSLIVGVLICFLNWFSGDYYGFFKHLHYEDYVIGCIAILAGIGFITYHFFFKSKPE